MGKRRRSPIVGQVIDGGTFDGDDAPPGGSYYITEDGRRLTPDEFLRPGDPAGPGGQKGMAAASRAAGVALAHYHAEEGIDVHLSYSETARKIAEYADKHHLPDAERLNPEAWSMRELVRDMVESLKRRR